MRIAVVSDIHGNALALEAVLEDLRAESPDAAVCLGDAVQGGPQPAEVVARLRGLGWPVVMGNADAFLLDGVHSEAEAADEARRRDLDRVRAWSLSKLDARDLDDLRGFRPTIELPLGGERTLLAYHATPRNYDDQILPDTPAEQVRGWIDPEPRRIYCGGHTHVQFVRHLGPTFHFNPGSVGLAYRHDQEPASFRMDSFAEYALLSVVGERIALEFRRVPYERARLVEIYRASGRPGAEEMVRRYGG